MISLLNMPVTNNKKKTLRMKQDQHTNESDPTVLSELGRKKTQRATSLPNFMHLFFDVTLEFPRAFL
jgi:hypothetical protein